MTDRPPITVSEPEWERGLWWMVLASGGLHLVAIALLLLIPHTFLHRPPPIMSYTVDLVAPDKIGGTNMIQGGKGRVEAPPMAAAAPPAPKVEPPKPPPPKVEEPKLPEPPQVEPPQPVPQAVAKPPPEPPKVEEKPKEADVALAEKVKKIEPPPPPTVAQPAPTPQAQPAPSPKAVAKAEPPKPQPSAPPKVDAKAAKAAAEAKAAEAKAAKEAAEAKARDQRIAAAIKRVEQQSGTRGGGTGSKVGEQPGGPISVGPGEGAGGTVRGVEYLLYRNQLESRIKQNWAWAGGNRALEAVVHFSITETGEVVDVRIIKSSGDLGYDTSIERAVRVLNPLPPPPTGYRKEFADCEYTFTPESLRM